MVDCFVNGGDKTSRFIFGFVEVVFLRHKVQAFFQRGFESGDGFHQFGNANILIRGRFGVCQLCFHKIKVKRIVYKHKKYFNFLLARRMLLVLLMDEAADSTAPEKAKNGREIFTKELAEEIISACGSGFTLEKAGALVGVNPSTIKTWASRKPDFARRVESARKKHELSLLRDIELAGQKSWQAKAWMSERVYGYAQPSARLQVSQDVTHGISGNLASLLAGIAGRKKVKKAEVIETQTLPQSKMQIASVATTSAHKSQIEYCIKSEMLQPEALTPKIPRTKHKRMKLRKPRAESLAKYPTTTTPPANPPATI